MINTGQKGRDLSFLAIKLRQVLPLLTQTINTVIEINHKYYYPAGLSDSYFNPAFYLSQLHLLTKEMTRIEKLLDCGEIDTSRSKSVPRPFFFSRKPSEYETKRKSAPKTLFFSINPAEGEGDTTLSKKPKVPAGRSRSLGGVFDPD